MNQIFLLGAGFTRAVIGERAPLTNEIMPKLSISKFPEIAEDYERTFPDIEQFISRIDLKYLHYKKINKSLSNRFGSIREDLIAQIVSLVDINQLYINELNSYPLLKNFIKIVPNKSFILSLNYDCILDQGLYYSGRWLPFKGYLIPVFPHTPLQGEEKDEILLIKLHGSCNFRDPKIKQEYFNIEVNNKIFPQIYSDINSSNSSLDKGPHVLVMSYIKQFHNGIMRLWRETISAIKNAEKLIIVGCSLREEDTFLRFALYHFGMKENNDKFFIDIVDKGEINCNLIRDKILTLVAYPDRQTVAIYHKGLEGYLSEN